MGLEKKENSVQTPPQATNPVKARGTLCNQKWNAFTVGNGKIAVG